MEVAKIYYCLGGEAALLVGIILFFFVGLYAKVNNTPYRDMVLLCFFCIILILLGTIHNVYQLACCHSTFSILNGVFVLTPFICYCQLFILMLVLVLIIGSYDYLCNHIFPIFELFLLTLASLLGIFLLLKANSLFVLYLSIEIQSIALYVLISARQSSVYTIEASLKYFIPSVFLTLVLLFGISLIYSSLGTLSFVDLKLLLTESTDWGLIHVGLCLVCCGFLFKLAVFPFHGWIADLYSGTNIFSLSFIATITKIAFLIPFLKLIFLFSFYKFTLGLVLGILGSITILFGTVVGLYQVKFLRILAFSSMVYMGQIVMAISTQSIDGVAAGCYLMLIYSIVSLCIFFIIMCFRTSAGWELNFIVDLAELIKSNKLLALVLMTFMLSLAGVPPFAGFCGKFLLVVALWNQGEYVYAVIILSTSVLTAVYYLRTIRFLYFLSQKEVAKIQPLPISNLSLAIILILGFFFNGLLFFFQEPLVAFITSLIGEEFFGASK